MKDIKFTKDGLSTNSECNTCEKSEICAYKKTLDRLEMPSPFDIYFRCAHFEWNGSD